MAAVSATVGLVVAARVFLYLSTSWKAMEMERQILSFQTTLPMRNVYINAGMSKDFTDLPDFKIIFIIVIYSLSLLLITNCNKERKKKKVHHDPAAPGIGLWWPPFLCNSCLSTHRLFRAGTEQRDSFGSVCICLHGVFNGSL